MIGYDVIRKRNNINDGEESAVALQFNNSNNNTTKNYSKKKEDAENAEDNMALYCTLFKEG